MFKKFMKWDTEKGIYETRLTFFLTVIVMLILVFDCVVWEFELLDTDSLKDVSTLQASDFYADPTYTLHEADILASYPYSTTKGDTRRNYYPILFKTGDGETCLATLRVSSDDDIFQELWDYSNSETLLEQGMQLSFCATARESNDDTLAECFQDVQSELTEQGVTCYAVPYLLVYKSRDAASVQASITRNQCIIIVANIIMLIFTLGAIFLEHRKPRKRRPKRGTMDGPEIL